MKSIINGMKNKVNQSINEQMDYETGYVSSISKQIDEQIDYVLDDKIYCCFYNTLSYIIPIKVKDQLLKTKAI